MKTALLLSALISLTLLPISSHAYIPAEANNFASATVIDPVGGEDGAATDLLNFTFENGETSYNPGNLGNVPGGQWRQERLVEVDAHG